MEFLLLLGIPIFFGLGWIAARIDINQILSESRTLPKKYFKGLNFLLNEQPDQAIDAFIEIVKLDPETIDLHFILGNLFRRRGEIERAIRVHQNLLIRSDLQQEQKNYAQYELGQDYLKAGLLDRAEETFHLLNNTKYSIQASHALLEIYQREKEWERAIVIARTLQSFNVCRRQKEIAQFYCELAEDELVRMNLDTAILLLKKALLIDRTCVRSTILLGDVYLAKGKVETALLIWCRVEQQSILYVALVAQRLLDAYKIVGRMREGLNLLRSYLTKAPSVDLLEVIFNGVLQLDGIEAINQLVTDDLRRTPTLLGLDKFLEAQILKASKDVQVELILIKNLVHNYTKKLAKYQCTYCGFKVRQFYWHCPGCNQWETYPPRRIEELNIIN